MHGGRMGTHLPRTDILNYPDGYIERIIKKWLIADVRLARDELA
jgi:hypothetical protein